MGMFSQLAQGVDWSSLGAMALRVVVVLLCLVVHEVCHGLAAYWLGDPTAKRNHRLSLNPLRHLDPFGLLMMVVVGFGWAKPVPVDPRYFKNPKGGMAITALAGPLSNLLMAYLSALALGALSAVAAVRGETAGLTLWLDFFALMVSLNIGLGIFNLIPVPALDGGKVVFLIIEGVTGHAVPEKLQSWLTLAAFALLFGLMLFATYNDIIRLLTGAM